MKKFLSFLLLFSFSLLNFGLVTMPVKASETIEFGAIVKTADSSTLYYIGDDEKLYVFPNSQTYFSWFNSFDDVQIISSTEFAEYELGGSVYYQPGSLLVKTPSSLKVYAVGINGELHWIETEELAKTYYGENWNLLVDDIPDSFFTSYRFGTSVDVEEDYDPEEISEWAQTIGHNKGFKKAKKKVRQALRKEEKRCEYLQNSINKLQIRASRWGIEIPSIGDDYLGKCLAGISQTEDDEEEEEDDSKKVDICKMPRGNMYNFLNIRISKNALKKYFSMGYLYGKCGEEDNDDDSDDDDDDSDDVALTLTNIQIDLDVDSAIVTWDTNILADSKVKYDDDAVVNFNEEVNTTNKLEHTITISALDANTKYYYIVYSEDADGNIVESSVREFTTLEEEETTELSITNVEIDVDVNSAIITWDTNILADSKVMYDDDAVVNDEEESDSTDVLEHSIELTGLGTDTLYYYVVYSEDADGNIATTSIEDFTTLEEVDETAPVISNISLSIQATTTIISWDTDEPATSKVVFATETIDNDTVSENIEDTDLVESHELELSGLATSTMYYFFVESMDASANTASSSEETFTTLED